MLPKNRPPTSPGEILLEEFLKPLGMTQLELSAKMKVPVQRVNTLINGRRAVTPETAILLSRVLKDLRRVLDESTDELRPLACAATDGRG